MPVDRLAVISDVHANVEALQAVFDDIDRQGITRIICLGDMVGYGPDPGQCIDMVGSRCDVMLCGNHDHAVMYEPNGFHLAAEASSFWTREQLETEKDRKKRNARWDIVGRLPVRHMEGNLQFVHGSPRKPVNEYLFAEDVYTNPGRLIANFERITGQACFVGHTHVPGVLFDEPYFELPEDLADPFCHHLGGERAIINVGSVGQPRDRDVRSSYVTVEDDRVFFHRVEYDVETCVRKIMDIPELEDYLGQRLLDGR